MGPGERECYGRPTIITVLELHASFCGRTAPGRGVELFAQDSYLCIHDPYVYDHSGRKYKDRWAFIFTYNWSLYSRPESQQSGQKYEARWIFIFIYNTILIFTTTPGGNIRTNGPCIFANIQRSLYFRSECCDSGREHKDQLYVNMKAQRSLYFHISAQSGR